MTDELDPKLREFEAKLRQLKPLDVSRCNKVVHHLRNDVDYVSHKGTKDTKECDFLSIPLCSSCLCVRQKMNKNNQCYLGNSLPPPEGRRPTYRIAACALAIVVMAMAIVWFIPQPPQPVLPLVEPTLVATVAVRESVPTTLPTMRRQLVQLLDEINVADAIAEKQPVYPVVEIVVCDAPPKRLSPLPIDRLRFRVDEYELLMF